MKRTLYNTLNGFLPKNYLIGFGLSRWQVVFLSGDEIGFCVASRKGWLLTRYIKWADVHRVEYKRISILGYKSLTIYSTDGSKIIIGSYQPYFKEMTDIVYEKTAYEYTND